MSSKSPRPPVRRAKGEPRRPAPEAEPEEQAPVVASPPPEAPKAPSTSEEAAPKLVTDDLEALASMSPDELAALMEGAVAGSRTEVGDQVTGRVTRIGTDTVFVDIGAKSEGQLDLGEAPDASVGDEITAYIVATGEWGVALSKQLQGQAAAELIEEAHASGVPVEGKVVSRNKGGYDVRIGTARAFCPASMISRLPDLDPDAYVGQTLAFRIIETGDKVVVSRRALQEEEAEEAATKLWATLAEGQQHRGIVRNVQNFGFFVDIGGVDGLVPKREIAWGGVSDPRTAVQRGQSVEVRVIEVDHANKKLTLSCRDLADDPWNQVGTAFQEGGVYEGSVVRSEAYGVFVELDTGLQGLVHVSKLPSGMPQPGERLKVRLLSIDHDRRRLELSVVGDDAVATEGVSDTVSGVVSEVLHNGVVVQLDDGRTGWLSSREVDLDPGTVLAQRFRKGKKVTGRVTSERGGRVNLSMRDDDAGAQQQWRAAQAAQKEADKGFGTLGDLLSGLNLKK
jgi:small subunit ribosomal protein S1